MSEEKTQDIQKPVVKRTPEEERKHIEEALLEAIAFNEKETITSMIVLLGDDKKIMQSFGGNPQDIIITLKSTYIGNNQLFNVIKHSVMEHLLDMETKDMRDRALRRKEELQKMKEEKTNAIGGESNLKVVKDESDTETEKPDSESSELSSDKQS